MRSIALVVILLAAGLAGCASNPSPSPSASATPSPTATSTPSGATVAYAHNESFDAMSAGGVPVGWTAASGNWSVEANATAPSAPNVVRQSAMDQKFPVLTLDAAPALSDVDVSARFAVLSGEKALAGGVVFRFVDANNYYAARANGNEGNFALFHTINGNREKLKEAESPTGLHQWLSVRAVATGATISVYSGETKLFDYTETTPGAPVAGKVGLWTKDDSVTLFDDFKVEGKTSAA